MQETWAQSRVRVDCTCWGAAHFIEKASKRVPEKTSTSALLTMPKPLTLWTTTNSGKLFKRWEFQTTWPASWKIYIQVKKQQLEHGTVPVRYGTTDWFQTGKGVLQGCILSPCLFNLHVEYIMRTAKLDEAQEESRLLGKISITSVMQTTPPLWQKVKKN